MNITLNLFVIIGFFVLTAIACGSMAVHTDQPYQKDNQSNLNDLLRWSIKFSDPQEWENSQEGFGGIGEFSDKTIGFMFLLWKQGTYMDRSDGESIHWIKNIGRF